MPYIAVILWLNHDVIHPVGFNEAIIICLRCIASNIKAAIRLNLKRIREISDFFDATKQFNSETAIHLTYGLCEKDF
jgi:hypothetical protein